MDFFVLFVHMNVQNFRHVQILGFFYVPEVLNVHMNESKNKIYFF